MENMAQLQSFVDGVPGKIDFPAHHCVYGKSMSGKSYLVTEILNNMEKLLKRSESIPKILVVLSPHDEIEQLLKDRLLEKWTIIHFNVEIFNQFLIDQMLNYLASERLLGKEIVVLMDDLIVQTSSSSNINLFIVKSFAILRHKNISLFATVQNNCTALWEILQNCAYIYIMQSFGCFTILTKIIRVFLGLINVPNLIRKIYPLLEDNRRGSYIFINISRSANFNKEFTIANNIFQYTGFTKSYLTKLSVEDM